MNITALTAFFESFEDFGDVGDYEDPDIAIAQVALNEYNKRSGEHFDISKFTRAEKEHGIERRNMEGDVVASSLEKYNAPLYVFYPVLKNILPDVEVHLEVERVEGYPPRIQLKLILVLYWGNHQVIRELLELRGTRVAKYNGEDVEEDYEHE